MADGSIFNWSVTPGNNGTTINGINMAEFCPTSGFNDAVRQMAAAIVGANLAVATSGTNTYTATLAPAPGAVVDGMTIQIRFANANTSAAPTLNINSLGAVTITKNGGFPLAPGDIPAGHEAQLRYVNSSTTWVLMNPFVGAFSNFLSGLTLSNDATTPNSVLDVAVGSAMDSTNAQLMTLPSAWTKSTAGTFATGSGSNGLDTGSVSASTWYHVYLIAGVGKATDIIFSTSASAPSYPSGFTISRRIGSFKTDASSHILKFTQYGNEFWWTMAVLDQNGSAIGTSPANVNVVSVPANVKTIGRFRVIITGQSANINFVITSPDETITVTTSGNCNLLAASTLGTGQIAGEFLVRTNAASPAQVQVLSNTASTTYFITTVGWIDLRGVV